MRGLSSSILLFPTTHHPFPYKANQNTLLFSHSKHPSSPKCPPMTSSTTTISATSLRRRNKVVVVMGPTGSGKSKLSVDLASRFFPSSEIINSDKIQLHRGLDITTNKIPLPDRKNVPHHLLGELDPSQPFTPSDFRSSASLTISHILSRRKIPFVVGGSNSFIYALLAKKFSPPLASDHFVPIFCRELRYSCCFIWVDVSPPVLNEYLARRVDDMLDSGMLDELSEFFADPGSVNRTGLRKAIGVPEFERYFKLFGHDWRVGDGDVEKRREYDVAVGAIKENTCRLAKRQHGKIVRLRDAAGWELKRVDATTARMGGAAGRREAEIWERQVVEPSVKIVNRFLME